MFSAFVTGFAKESTKMIDERNKEISERALSEMESLLKKKVEADEAALTKRNEYREQAQALRELSGKRLTENQVKGILQSGQAKTVIDNLKKRTVGTDKLAKLFVPANEDDQKTIEDYIKEATALTGTAPPQIEERTAFGLRTRAGESVRQRAAAAAGVPLEELYKTEIAGMPTESLGTLNIGALLEEKEKDAPSIKELQERLVDTALDNNMSPEEYAKTEEGGKLAARIEGRRLIGATDDEEKARTAAQIRTLVTTRLQEEIAPLQFKSITFDPNINDFVVTIPGSPEAKQFLEKRRAVVADVFSNAGLLRGSKLSDRNAADAISPFAEVDYNNLTIKSWRSVAGAKTAPGAPVPTPGGSTAPVPPAAAAPAPKPAGLPEGARPLPLAADGKVDRSKLEAGIVYYGKSGSARLWNGTGFQPLTNK